IKDHCKPRIKGSFGWTVCKTVLPGNWTSFCTISMIPYGNSSELIFNTVHVKDAGFYVCRVNNSSTFEFSQWSQLDVCDVTEVPESFQGSVDGVSESKLQICVEPRSQKLMPGSTLVLQCVAIGSPMPHYQWFKNESPLIHETKKHY
ncbi:hypothetical protein A6R68_15354, partial [Neotoma lepida]